MLLSTLAESLVLHPNTILGDGAANCVHSVTYSSDRGNAILTVGNRVRERRVLYFSTAASQ